MSRNKLTIFKTKNKGVSLVSYGLLVGLIAILAIAAITNIGSNVSGLFSGTATRMNDAAASGSSSGASSGGSSGTPDPCASSPTPGTTCADGTVFAGLRINDSQPIYIMPTDQSTSVMWKTSQTASGTFCASDSATCFSGAANTTSLVPPNFTAGTHPAAELCDGFTGAGYTDWYLPSIAELDVIYSNLVANNFADPGNDPDNPLTTQGTVAGGTVPTSYSGPLAGTFEVIYWSSSEISTSNGWFVQFTNGIEASNFKDTNYAVRCVRK